MHRICVIVPEGVGRPVERALESVALFERCDVTPEGDAAVALSIDAALSPEAFRIDVRHGPPPRVSVSAGDDVGLAYALFELAAQIELQPERDLHAVSAVERAPYLPVRGLDVFPVNPAMDPEWLYDRAHWEWLCGLMARSRMNQLALVLGHETPLFTPPWPFLVDVPGWERVRPVDCDADQRARNLEMLRTIADVAASWGIRFVLGIWQQIPRESQDSLVEGLAYDDAFAYNPAGLAALLEACPEIDGLQFRMNRECGIDEDDQKRLFGGVLEAVRNHGGPKWLDLRAKGLREETIHDAVDRLGLDVTISTKFWCEHMGLPHLATEVNPRDAGMEAAYRRYGHWDLLPHDRPYDMLYRLWTQGSHKLTVWGDIEYARRFARSCRLGEGVGFEVASPLTNKGIERTNPVPSFRIFRNQDDEHFRWERERYWAFHMAFGLAGYDPDGAQPVWDAEFQRRFGPAARDMKTAYDAAGDYLPLATASHLPSASCFTHWPEMDTGGLSDEFIHTPPSDLGRFASVVDAVRERRNGIRSGRVTPSEVAERFDAIDAAIDAKVTMAEKRFDGTGDAAKEFRATCADLRIIAALSRYRAARFRSGEAYAWFLETGERDRLREATSQLENALRAWRAAAEHGRLYADRMVFSIPPHQCGHWSDRTPYLEYDVQRLHDIGWLLDRFADKPDAPELRAQHEWLELETHFDFADGRFRRWTGGVVPAEAPPTVCYETKQEGHRALAPEVVARRALVARGERRGTVDPADCATPLAADATVTEYALSECRPGECMTVRAVIRSAAPVAVARLHHRPFNQVAPWQCVAMTPSDNAWQADVPGEAILENWDLQLAVEIIDTAGRGAFWPPMDITAPYLVVDTRTGTVRNENLQSGQ